MNSSKKRIAVAIGISVSLMACSPNKTVDEYIQSAQQYEQKNNFNAAVLELKNAIQLEPNNHKIRLELGKIYLQQGDYASAEKELIKALDNNGTLVDVLPPLLKVMVLQDNYNEVLNLVDKYSPIPEVIDAPVTVYQAIALINLGETEQAKQLLATFNDPVIDDSTFKQLGLAYFQAINNQYKESLATLEHLLTQQPDMVEAILLQAQLYFIQQQYDLAAESYSNTLKLLPKDLKLHLLIANTLIKTEQFEQAEPHVELLLKNFPEHAFTNQLWAIILFQKQDFANALMAMEKAIQNGLNTISNRVIAGISAFRTEKYELAHQYLSSVADNIPENHPVKRLFALVQLKLGYTNDVTNTLEQLENIDNSDIDLYTTASFELLKSGKLEQAKQVLDKIDNVALESTADLTKVGILKLSLNDLGGIVDLEKAIEIDPNLPMAKMALATAYTQNKQYEKALALAEKWKQEAPFKIDGYNLAAKVYLLQNKTVEAEAELQQSLNIEPNNIYALIYYANQSFRNEQYEQAISYLERILEKTPENSAALSLYYIVHSKLGKPLVAVNFIEKQFTEHKDNQNLKLLYAQVLHDQKKFEKVINLLKETQSPEADLPAKYWIILGDSFLKTNQLENALTVYNKFTIYHPNYRTAWLGKIKTLELQENYLEALVTTDKALKLAPNDSQFNVLRAYYQILTKQFDKARTQLAKLNKEQLENPLVKVIKGQLLLQEGSYKEGLDNLLAYYQVQPSSPLAHLIFNTYIKLKQSKQALQFLSRHVMDYPKDIASKITLAEFSIDYAPNVAIDNYQQLVKLYPDNLTFLNNLAWVLYLEGKYKAADTIITRALKIKDDIPQLLDTAGLIKFKQGDIVKAEELLKRAMLLSPNDSSILAHYNEVKKVL